VLESNVNKVSGLISRLLSIIPIENLLDAVIFGSSAITLNGIDLERSINDLDIFVSNTDYEKLKQLANLKELEKIGKNTGNKVFSLKVAGIEDIEILKDFPGVNHAEVLSKALVKNYSNNLKVASIEDLVNWKTVQGRPKDLADLTKMQNFLLKSTHTMYGCQHADSTECLSFCFAKPIFNYFGNIASLI